MMGARSPQARAKSLLSNLGCQIYHASSCHDTNMHGANIVGYDIQIMASMNGKVSAGNAGNLSEQMMLQIQPNEFVSLKTGRKENNYRVEAYIIKTGPWKHTRENYIKAEFKQN